MYNHYSLHKGPFIVCGIFFSHVVSIWIRKISITWEIIQLWITILTPLTICPCTAMTKLLFRSLNLDLQRVHHSVEKNHHMHPWQRETSLHPLQSTIMLQLPWLGARKIRDFWSRDAQNTWSETLTNYSAVCEKYQLKIILSPSHDFESVSQFSMWRLYTMSHSEQQTKLT